MSRLKGFLACVGGMILILLGVGMWHSPEIDWEGFLSAWTLISDEFNRLVEDPFAVLGIVVLVIGAFVLLYGLRRLARG